MPGETPEGNIDVLIVAAKKDVTNSYVSVVREAGLNPVVVDVDVFALENMYMMNYPESDGLVSLVNIGASVTNINILKDAVSVFTRDITTGGNLYTEWIMKEMNVPFEEAELLKISAKDGEAPPELARVTREFVDMISGEIKRTLDFFSSTLWTSKVNHILIGGGSSGVDRSQGYALRHNRRGSRFHEPLQERGIRPQRFRSRIHTVHSPQDERGHGARFEKAGGQQMIRINLIPEPEKRDVRGVGQLVLGLLVIVALFAVLAALHVMQGRQIEEVNRKIARAEKRIEELETIKEKVDDFKAKNEELNRRIDIIKVLESNRTGRSSSWTPSRVPYPTRPGSTSSPKKGFRRGSSE